MRRYLRDHGLTFTMLSLFAIHVAGQTLTGYRSNNQDMRAQGELITAFGAYLTSGHFIEATFENWESEYLQMSL